MTFNDSVKKNTGERFGLDLKHMAEDSEVVFKKAVCILKQPIKSRRRCVIKSAK